MVATTVETKQCIRCEKIKPLSYFNKHKPGHFRNICIKCQRRFAKDREKEMREKNKYVHIDAAVFKICAVCKEAKSQIEFPLDRAKKSGVGSWCKACTSAKRNKVYNEKSKEERYQAYLLTQYGITIEQKEGLFLKQQSKCGACGTTDPATKYNSWHVDHDHNTGRVRGILCPACNIAVGMAKNSIDNLLSLIRYLRNPPAHYLMNDLPETWTKRSKKKTS